MSIYQKEEVTLNELKQHLAVLDIEDGEMVADVKALTNGTFPREGAQIDRNGDEYRWHNFLVCHGSTYDQLAEEFGEDEPISWDVLYDYGITSSEFERDLNREVPRGAKATLVVQFSNGEMNVLSHELHIKSAKQADRFADHKSNGRAINQGSSQETTEETVNA